MKLTIDQALKKAVEAHKAGKVQDADRLYTAILKKQPKHPDANHNLGLLAVSVGKTSKALPFLKTALETNPKISQFWITYIDTLIKLDKLAEARAVLDEARRIGVKVSDFDNIEQRLKQSDQGLPKAIQKTEEPQPNLLNNLNSLNMDKEISLANKKISKPQDPSQDQVESLINLYKKGDLKQALLQVDSLIQQFPKSAFLYNIQGIVLNGLGRFDLSIEAYRKSITINPNYSNVYNNMGITFKNQGMLEEAINSYNKALAISPDFANVYNNIANALKHQGRLEEAIDAYNKALAIKPDYSVAYLNSTELLKAYSPRKKSSHCLFNIDKKIKNLSSKILHAKSNKEITDCILEGLCFISEDRFNYKTPLSQIYKHNSVDLNCTRHKKIFNTKNIIPEFCFGCFKVQVDISTFIDLVKLTTLFYKFNFEEDLTKKTIIELRPNISGYYKGLIYCKGLAQAEAVKFLLDISLKKVFGNKTISKIKRGCSEYSIKFPSYDKISKDSKKIMRYPEEWKLLENKFDEDELILPKDKQIPSLQEFCLSDFYIIQKWIDYAKGIGDLSIECFNDRPIVYTEIYEKAKKRARHL